jgi:GLPGLI family protein
MKTILKSLMILSIALLSTSLSVSAQGFKGVLVYTLSYTGNIDAATLAQQPKTMTMSILGNKTKMNFPVGPIVIDVITDADKKETMTLIDMMGEKKYYKTTDAEIQEEQNKNGAPVIRYLDETKTIAGYTCKKAEFVTKDDDDKEVVVTVYYSEEIAGPNANYGGSFPGLKGFPMEYTMTQGEINTTFTVTEVKKGKVKETDFLLPVDYVEFTPEEKAQMKAAFSGKEE